MTPTRNNVEPTTSATDELRRMLDELRKLACDINEKEIRSHSIITLNQGRYNRQFRLGMNHDWLNAWHAEFERILQVIAATLGSCNCTNDCTNGERTETCKLNNFADVPFSVDYEIEGYDMDSGRDYATLAECSACGAYIIVPPEYHHVLTCDGDEVYRPYRFCPNCGRRVEVDE